MDKILGILEKDANVTSAQIALMLGEGEADVAARIKKFEEDRIILGYKTIIDWEKTDKEIVTALIELKVAPQFKMGYDKIAEQICRHEEVQDVYLMSGSFDLTVIIAGKTMKEVARFVSEKLAPMEAVLSTATHFVLKKYKEQGITFGPDICDERGAIFI